MGASNQPYLYNPPSRQSVVKPYAHSDFNPRAATQAHDAAEQNRAERQKQQAQQDGRPLINFNAHPDSYMVITGRVVDHKPMPPNTKKALKITRWVLWALRCLQQICALGLLVCFICLKMPWASTAWILRVTPAWDALVGTYAIYHLTRPAKGRTPASSASYHFFALFMDTGLVPFYVFITLNSYTMLNSPSDAQGRWTSFFSTIHATNLLMLVTTIGGAVMAGLHFISIAFDIYLIIVFRKIAHLPPDMNPLEPTLTSRVTMPHGHKHKNSEVNLSGGDMAERRRQAHLSGSTLSVDNQSHSSLMKDPQVKTLMPFHHSRMDSDASFSPHNPETARFSRQQFDDMHGYQDAHSARSSRVDLAGGHHPRSGSQSPSKRASYVPTSPQQPGPMSDRSHTPRPGSFLSARRDELGQSASPALPNAAQPAALLKSQQEEGLLNENWCSIEDEVTSDLGSPGRRRVPAPTYDASKPAMSHARNDSAFVHQPLRMNPPTPPMESEEFEDPDDQDEQQHRQHSRYEAVDASLERAGTVLSSVSSVYSDTAESLRHSATPKGKYYGNLDAATRGVRGVNSPGTGLAARPGHYGVPTPQPSRSPSPGKKYGRVVSRTGADIADVSTTLLSEQQYTGMKGRRQVSGKVAEEGRAGWEMWKR